MKQNKEQSDIDLSKPSFDAKLNQIVKEMVSIMLDPQVMTLIKDKSFMEFSRELPEHTRYCPDMKQATIFGHRVEALRYYCDTFNKEQHNA